MRMEPIGKRRSRHEKIRDFLKKFLKFFSEFFRREKADIEIAQIGQNRPNQKNFLGFERIRKKCRNNEKIRNFLKKFLGW